LRNQKYCYFHQEHREKTVRINANRRRTVQEITLPVLEDANSIQVGVMHVLGLLLGGQIDRSTAGVALYALQIASCNLPRTSFEAERPTQVIIDQEKVAETPMGMTPWSACKPNAHDSEEDEDENSRAKNVWGVLMLFSVLERMGIEPAKTEQQRLEREGLAQIAGYKNWEEYRKEAKHRIWEQQAEEMNADPEEEGEDAGAGDEEEDDGGGININACVDERVQ
jgi:hypothetical protein